MTILREAVRNALRTLLYEEAVRWVSSPEGQRFLDDISPRVTTILERAEAFMWAAKAPMTLHIVHHFSSKEAPPCEHDYPREGGGREPFGPIPPIDAEFEDRSDCHTTSPEAQRDCAGVGHHLCATCTRRVGE